MPNAQAYVHPKTGRASRSVKVAVQLPDGTVKVITIAKGGTFPKLTDFPKGTVQLPPKEGEWE